MWFPISSLYLAFNDFAFFKHSFYRKRRLLKRVPYLFIFVIRENEILIAVIRDSLFFLFVNRARDPPVRPSLSLPFKTLIETLSTESVTTSRKHRLSQCQMANQTNIIFVNCSQKVFIITDRNFRLAFQFLTSSAISVNWWIWGPLLQPNEVFFLNDQPNGSKRREMFSTQVSAITTSPRRSIDIF